MDGDSSSHFPSGSAVVLDISADGAFPAKEREIVQYGGCTRKQEPASSRRVALAQMCIAPLLVSCRPQTSSKPSLKPKRLGNSYHHAVERGDYAGDGPRRPATVPSMARPAVPRMDARPRAEGSDCVSLSTLGTQTDVRKLTYCRAQERATLDDRRVRNAAVLATG